MSKIFDPESEFNQAQKPLPPEIVVDNLAAAQFANLDTAVEPRPEINLPAPVEEVATDSRFGGGVIRAAMVVSLGNVLTRIFGLLRESILANLAGTGLLTGAFVVADNTLSIFFDLVVNGAISAALVPVLSHYAANAKDRREFWKIVNTLLTLGTLFMLLVVAVLELFADPLGRFMSAGYDQATQDLAVKMMRVVLFAIVFLGISSIMMAALQAMQKFAWSALSLVARNGGVVAAGLILWHLGVWSLVIGLLFGTFMLIVLQTPGLRGNRFRPEFNWKHPAIAEILKLYRPIFLGLVVTSTMLVIDRNLASSTGDNALGAMRFATTLQQFALGLVGTAISIAILPTLSRQANNSNNASYRQTLMNGMRLLTVLIVPATLGLLALSIPAVTLIYERGKFNDTSKWLTLIALFGYLPGLPAAAYDQMLVVAFYARRNTLTPVLVGIVSNLAYLMLALSLTKIFNWGMIGLVLANSSQQIVHMSIMFVLLNRYFKKQPQKNQIQVLPILFKTTLAALLMGCMAFLTSQLILGQKAGFIVAAAALIVGVATGLVTYIVGLRLMHIEELSLVWGAVSRKFRRA